MKPESKYQRKLERKSAKADRRRRKLSRIAQQAKTEATATTDEWQPLQRAAMYNDTVAQMVTAKHDDTWMNNLYTVQVTRNVRYEDSPTHPQVHELSIRRNDRQAALDWRHLQKIKDELVGENHEGVMLFPHRNRLVDTSNQFYVYVLADADQTHPFGMDGRLVSEGASGNVQRPFQPGLRPDDTVAACGVHVDAIKGGVYGAPSAYEVEVDSILNPPKE